MAKVTISLPEDMNERIEDDLEYGDSRSEWVRQAIRYRFIIDENLDESLPDDEKIKAVKEALTEHADSQ